MDMGKLMVAAAVAACSCGAFAAIRAVTPAEKGVERHALKMKAIAAEAPKVVFIGDSITHFWEVLGRGKGVWDKFFAEGPQKALCLGTSGDRTENVLWRIENGELDGYEAKCVMLMIGTNSGGGDTPADVAAGIRTILAKIAERQPKAKVVLVPVFPRGEKPDGWARRRNAEINGLIRGFADGGRVIWCDFGDRLLQPDGTISKAMMPDFLHPQAAGYDIWADAVAPLFARIVGH